MQIRVLNLFKHGYDTFHPGDVRTVSDEDGAYFAAHGWAKPTSGPGAGDPEPAAAPAQPPVTLDVQSVTTPQGVQHG